jgi:hypothetical protein
MKTTALIIAIIGCIALGIFGYEQSAKLKARSEELAQTKQELASVQADLSEKEEAIEKAKSTEAKSKILQQTLAESTVAAVAESKKSEQLKASLEEEKTNNPLHAVAGMFKDPKMREMMKAQQKAVLGPVIEKQYSDLFKQLNLTPEQAAAFKDLVGKKMLAGTDVGLSMLDDSVDASQRADMVKQVKEQTDELDNQIKQFLGDDNYKAYQSYEKTVPDRMAVSQFNDQFAGTENALTPSQQQQMIQELSEARSGFNWTSGLNQQNAAANGDISAMLTPENIDKFAAEREQFDQQFLARAQKFLTPAQIAAYQDFQKAQSIYQLTGLKMAAQMLGTKSK